MICVAKSWLIKKAAPIALLCFLSIPSFARRDAPDSRVALDESTVSSHVSHTHETPLTAPAFSWSADRKLTWDDFTGPADEYDDITAAATYCGIGFESKAGKSSETVSIKVYNKFFPAKSWVKPGQLKSSILAHEQCHFDICELYTRILQQRLTQAAADKNVTADALETIYNNVQNEYAAFQELYEEETAHGTISHMQQMWEYKIAKELNEIDFLVLR